MPKQEQPTTGVSLSKHELNAVDHFLVEMEKVDKNPFSFKGIQVAKFVPITAYYAFIACYHVATYVYDQVTGEFEDYFKGTRLENSVEVLRMQELERQSSHKASPDAYIAIRRSSLAL